MDRYYVQRVSEHLLLVRELQTPGDVPSTHDPIIRRFVVPDDARYYANRMNEVQGKLDAANGQQWVSHAVTSEHTGGQQKENDGH